jgi:PEP-CTERM motif
MKVLREFVVFSPLKADKTMRNHIFSAALCLFMAAPVAAKADTITYTFNLIQQTGQGTFSPDNNQIVGSGSFTLTSTTPTPGLEYKAIDQNNQNLTNFISSIDFKIDGLDFTLADANSTTDPKNFTNTTDIKFDGTGTPTQILYTSSWAEVPNLTFNGNGGLTYTYWNNLDQNGSNGSVVITAEKSAAAITPEPASLFLFGTGILVLAGFFKKRLA